MKRTLLALGIMVALGTTIIWGVLGANKGWTKTSVPVKTMDEITGIEAITYEKRFLPGMEFLGGGLLGGGILMAISLLFKRRQSTI